ncbi:MAG: HAMP domain-containing histidine kinase [Alphaproteobacteria bacterium]|nr:MAG: HAMP domain-containing histidine kinase [Alphaproteobacteria bacterium]
MAKASDPKETSMARRVIAFFQSVSGQLLVLTVLIVMLAEVLIYVPSIARFRISWLEDRLEAAQIAVLALEARPDRMVDRELADELLRNAEVFSVTLTKDGQSDLYLGHDMPPPADHRVDLRGTNLLQEINQAFGSLRFGEGRVLEVMGSARYRDGTTVEIVIDETGLCQAMFTYSRNILGLSIIIALFTASLIYLALLWFFVRPILRITNSMDHFRLDPESSASVIQPSKRHDEIGQAEVQLAAMQEEVQSALQQKARLAALGTAVSKINHDLKNILTSAQLMSDRIGTIDDPTVQRLAPKLYAAIDRAVNLCVNTLRYGRADEPEPVYSKVALKGLGDDVAASLGLDLGKDIKFLNEVADTFTLEADPDKLYRILLNLLRNAQQALAVYKNPARPPLIRLMADQDDTQICIDVCDTGPGVPDVMREDLFKPFGKTSTPGGAGLGLAIARELAEAQGGTVLLRRTGVEGTCFRVMLPRRGVATDEPEEQMEPRGLSEIRGPEDAAGDRAGDTAHGVLKRAHAEEDL